MDYLIAQTTFGTKPSTPTPPPTSASPVSGLQMLQMLIALGIVGVLLKFGIPKLIGKWGKRLSPGADSTIDVLETAAFGAGQVQVVKVRGRTLLLGITAQNVSCLADLTEHEDARANEEPAFFEMLDQHTEEEDEIDEPVAVEQPSKAVVELPVEDEIEDEAETVDASADTISIEEAHRLLMAAKSRNQHKAAPQSENEEEDAFAALKRLEQLAQ